MKRINVFLSLLGPVCWIEMLECSLTLSRRIGEEEFFKSLVPQNKDSG